jgi:hypothetical protein
MSFLLTGREIDSSFHLHVYSKKAAAAACKDNVCGLMQARGMNKWWWCIQLHIIMEGFYGLVLN